MLVARYPATAKTIDVREDTIYIAHVNLSSGTYQFSRTLPDGTRETGRDFMKQAAMDVVNAYPELRDRLIVTVHEHAGWQLSYWTDGTIISSANDCAIFDEKAQKIRTKIINTPKRQNIQYKE